MISMTEKAGEKMKALLTLEEKPGYGLRVYVSGGGCSGFQYGMAFEEQEADDDQVYRMHGVKVFVDPHSATMLDGTEIDYNDGLQDTGFTIKNPTAKSTCGCGKSFST